MIILELNLSEDQVNETTLSDNVISVNLVEKGDPGEDGKTPIKGVDYFDGEDIKEITKQIQFEAGIDVATDEDIMRLF